MTNTDPRHARSAAALSDAVLIAAAETPIDDISVARLSRDAGVSRATFYNHADSPRDLLEKQLSRELDAIRDEFFRGTQTSGSSLRDVWRESERRLLAHVESHDRIYVLGFRGGLADVLSTHIETSLEQFVERDYPSASEHERLRSRMAATFVAQGSVGAIARWLESPPPRDVESALDVLMRSIPQWWLDLGPHPE